MTDRVKARFILTGMYSKSWSAFGKALIGQPNSLFARSLPGKNGLTKFQINRPDDSPTARPGNSAAWRLPGIVGSDSTRRRSWSIAEVALIIICFAFFSGQLPPDVNESHYLTKAKHFWDSSWCPNDIFLSSSFSHWQFYFSTGWVTKFVSLTAYAWIGRILTWCLLAIGWQRLSFRLIPVRGIAIVTAISFLLLNDQFHMAGEWVIGGFEAKGVAYACVIFAMERMVGRRWSHVWILLGIASAFHVLVGGWATVAAIASWFYCEVHLSSAVAKVKSQLPWLLGGLVIASIGIVPPLVTEMQSTRALADTANRIYVDSRISHHLLFGHFPVPQVARFGLIVFAWAMLARFLRNWSWIKPIQAFCLASLCISFGGLMLCGLEEQPGVVGDFSRGLLRFYWFRLSDFAVPAVLALSCGAIVTEWMKGKSANARRIGAWLFVVLILAAAGVLMIEKHTDPRPIADQRSLPTYPDNALRTLETFENWKKVCLWIKKNTATDSLFITPADQQTFKWYAHRAEVACWKDVPQDAEAMIEWYQRIQTLYSPQKTYLSGLMAYSDDQLTGLAEEYGADYLLIPQSQVDLANDSTELKQVYPKKKNTKSTYVVFVFQR